MILRSEEVVQTIDGREQARFIKELVHVGGDTPLAMVRKRLRPDALPGGRYLAPVLLLHGFGQNRYAWHLSGRSFANYLARAGFDVFNLDLRGHGRSRRLGTARAFSVDDYIREDMPAALAEVRRTTERARAFVLGHSLGGMIAYAGAAKRPDAIAGLVTFGAPYRFSEGSLTLLAVARIVGMLSGGKVPTDKTWGLPIRAVGWMLRSQRSLWDSKLVPLPVRAWAPGAMEPQLLGEYLVRSFDAATAGTLIHLAQFARDGRFCSGDGCEDYGAQFEACDLPLLVLAGAHDLLASPRSVRPAYEHSRSTDKTYRVLPLGHADLLLGRDATSTTWPLVVGWLLARLSRVDGAPPAV